MDALTPPGGPGTPPSGEPTPRANQPATPDQGANLGLDRIAQVTQNLDPRTQQRIQQELQAQVPPREATPPTRESVMQQMYAATDAMRSLPPNEQQDVLRSLLTAVQQPDGAAPAVAPTPAAETAPVPPEQARQNLEALRARNAEFQASDQATIEARFGRGWLGRARNYLETTRVGKALKIVGKVVGGVTLAMGSATSSLSVVGVPLAGVGFTMGVKIASSGLIEAGQHLGLGGMERQRQERDAQATYETARANLDQLLGSGEYTQAQYQEGLLAITRAHNEVLRVRGANMTAEQQQRALRGRLSTGIALAAGLFGGIPLGSMGAETAVDAPGVEGAHNVLLKLTGGQFVYNGGEVEAALEAVKNPEWLQGFGTTWTGTTHTMEAGAGGIVQNWWGSMFGPNGLGTAKMLGAAGAIVAPLAWQRFAESPRGTATAEPFRAWDLPGEGGRVVASPPAPGTTPPAPGSRPSAEPTTTPTPDATAPATQPARPEAERAAENTELLRAIRELREELAGLRRENQELRDRLAQLERPGATSATRQPGQEPGPAEQRSTPENTVEDAEQETDEMGRYIAEAERAVANMRRAYDAQRERRSAPRITDRDRAAIQAATGVRVGQSGTVLDRRSNAPAQNRDELEQSVRDTVRSRTERQPDRPAQQRIGLEPQRVRAAVAEITQALERDSRRGLPPPRRLTPEQQQRAEGLMRNRTTEDLILMLQLDERSGNDNTAVARQAARGELERRRAGLAEWLQGQAEAEANELDELLRSDDNA